MIISDKSIETVSAEGLRVVMAKINSQRTYTDCACPEQSSTNVAHIDANEEEMATYVVSAIE